MADRGGFGNVPGKGRRFRTPEGEYRYGAPGDVTAGIIPRIEKFFGRLFAPRGTDRFTPAEMNALLRGKNYALGGERQGPYVPDSILNAPPAPILPANSATGGGGGQPQFKAQPMTSQGQFDRYFGTSEMDPFFGSSSRGAGAPKTAEEMMALATQQKAPMETPLSTYYRSQSAAGRAEMRWRSGQKPTRCWPSASLKIQKPRKRGYRRDSYAHPRDLGAGAQAEQGYTLAAYGLTVT
jgi:hypothetical protein